MATTLPAHASIMTGTHPMTHGLVANAAFLPRDLDDAGTLRTLAEMLADRGYATAGFVSAAPLKRHSGIDRGFQRFDQPLGLQRGSRKTTELALRWLDDHDEGPFLLWVHYFDPHWPYQPPWKYRKEFTETRRLVSYLRRLGVRRSESARILSINNAYDGEVLYTDSQIGRLFERLKAAGLWDDSIVAVTSDHGEGLGQHDHLYHGRIYNEQLRVPLLMKLARQREGRRIGRVTSLVDLLPILTSAGGLPIASGDRGQFQGVDALGSSPGRAHVVSERTHRRGSWGPARRYALTGSEWKLLHSPTEGSALYHLGRDPHETRSVIDEHPEVADQLLAILSERIREHYREPDPASANQRDSETLRQLRALGYVD